MHRAAATGVPPAGPALHRVALDPARYRFAEAVRQPAAMIAASVDTVGLAVVFAITDRSLWFAVLAVLLVGLLVRALVYRPGSAAASPG